MAGFHEALDYWREGTKFVSRFRSYSREMMRGSYWNAAWLWLPWTLIGAKTLLDFASTLVLGLAGAALRSPLLVAWGASQAMGWVKPTVWLSTFVRTTEEELEGSSETTCAPWVSGRLKKAADEGGFFASVGATLAMSLLALPVWPLRLLARTIGALRRALEAAGRDAGTVKEPRSEDKLIR